MPNKHINAKIEFVILVKAEATRFAEVDFEKPARAQTVFSFGLPDDLEKDATVLSRCKVELAGASGEVAAEVTTDFLVKFDLSGTDEAIEPVDLRAPTMQAAHGYHRQLLIDLTGRFDIPTFRLDFDLDPTPLEVQPAE